MKKIAILGCNKIQEKSCVACAKCLKGLRKRDGQFEAYKDEDVELVALGNCGDCPGVIMPKIGHVKMALSALCEDFDVLHLGTCVVKATETAACPLDIEKVKAMVKNSFGKEVVAGTHNY